MSAPAAPAEDKTPDTTTDTQSAVERMFRYSSWVHVGPGADNCPDICEDMKEPKNECSNPLHFHAWVRLPNQFQHDRIREKALAAKGRRARQLRDPETDAYAALEEALDREEHRDAEEALTELVEELLDPDRWKDYAEAARAAQARVDESAGVEEGEDPPKIYAHIATDQERLNELAAKADDEPEILQSDEYRELTAHVDSYMAAVREEHEALVGPKREALRALGLTDVIEKVREERIRKEGERHFDTIYSRWCWFYCTYVVPPGGTGRFMTVEQVDEVAPEVYEALRATFFDLERSQNMGVDSGNS